MQSCRLARTLASALALEFLMVVGCATGQSSAGRPRVPFAGLSGPTIIAHRGGSLEAPENTLPAIRHALAVGAEWQEIDVTLSREGEVVVIHDDSVDRTTGGRGQVERLSWAELRKLDAGAPRPALDTTVRLATLKIQAPDFGDRFSGTRIPSLAEVLAVPETRLMIELKESSRRQELVEKTLRVIERANATERVALASFSVNTLWLAHDREPSVPLIGIVESAAAIPHMLALPITVLAVSTELVEQAMAAAPPGLAVWTWTVYDPLTAVDLAARGVHGIITDAPQAVIEALRQPPQEAPQL